MTTTPPPDDLQFTTAEPAAGFTPGSDAAGAMTCAQCQRPIAQYYFEVGGQVVCGACKGKLEGALAGEGTSRAGRITRASLFGIGAAILGAIIWFAVVVITSLEIGIVAILIGWLVGKAVHAGSAGRGGRRYQVVAAVLTYVSVAMSYGALGIRELVQEREKTGATSVVDSAAVARGDTARTPATAAPAADSARAAADSATGGAAAEQGSLAIAIALMLGFMFILPIAANLASMPGGLISLFILFIGIRQAWQMNAGVELKITGPHRVAAPNAA